jgi:hypothetical protein
MKAKVLFLTLAAFALAVVLPGAALAGHGQGSGGHSHGGPPSWAGGSGHSRGFGLSKHGDENHPVHPTKPTHGRDQQGQTAGEPTGTLNPAWTCKVELAQTMLANDGDATAFLDKFGTNANERNAFGKCVSQVAQSQGQAAGGSDGSSGDNECDSTGSDGDQAGAGDPAESGDQAGTGEETGTVGDQGQQADPAGDGSGGSACEPGDDQNGDQAGSGDGTSAGQSNDDNQGGENDQGAGSPSLGDLLAAMFSL